MSAEHSNIEALIIRVLLSFSRVIVSLEYSDSSAVIDESFLLKSRI